MNDEVIPLKTILIGCGGMGAAQAGILAELAGFELAAVCDTFEPSLREVVEARGVRGYADFAEALERESPEVVAICTANDTHAPLTIQAAETGVRGVYCEKPMATNLADAEAMVRACGDNDVALVINHQRRIGPDLIKARELIESGAIGRVDLIRGNCAGDLLSDGTHLVDSILWLAGDNPAEWVIGQVHRNIDDEMRERAAQRSKSSGRPEEPGYRYGHPVENGGFGIIGFEPDPADRRSLKVEILCGDLRDPRRAYQDYEIFGDDGRLWRTGDQSSPNLFVQDAEGGTWQAGLDDWTYKPVPIPDGGQGCWRPVEVPPEPESAIAYGYRRFARMIHEGEPHPMCGENALRGFEIIMAIYESARIHEKTHLPLEQDRFPLEMMIEGSYSGDR